MTPEERAHELQLLEEGQLLTQRERFLLDTIADLQRQLAAAEEAGYQDGLNVKWGWPMKSDKGKDALDAYMQQCVDEAVLAEAEWWHPKMYVHWSGSIRIENCEGDCGKRLAAARSRVQGKTEGK